MTDSKWTIREARPEDLAFIYATWARNYRYDSAIGRLCQNGVFFQEYNQVIDNILDQPDTTVWCAVKPDDENVIFGYLVSQPGIAHYCFVKEIFRREGIARSLLHFGEDNIKEYTHKTFFIGCFIQQFPVLTYNPFHLYKKGEPHGRAIKTSEQRAS